MDRQLGFLTGKGKSAGKQLGDGIAAGVDSAANKVQAASKKIQAARDKEADAVGKLRVAEEKLKEVRDKGGDGSTLARAEEARATALRKQAAALDNVKSETKALTSAQKELADAEKRAANPPKNSFGSGTSNILSGITSELNGVTSKFSTVGKGAGAGFVAGAVAALAAGALLEAGKAAAGLVADGFKSVVDSGVAFDKTFNNFQAVTGSSTTQMQAFRQEAIALGGDTQIAGANASDAAIAMTELAKAGLSVDQAMQAARGTLQLSAAAQISAADAATIQGNTLNTFSLQADQAGHAADVLANVANASSGEMTDFANGLQQGGAVAHQYGISLEDTAATLGVLANNGIKGSDAGTLMKSALLALASPSDQASQALDELNVHAFDANGNFVGMREIFNQLHTAAQNMTPEMYAMSTSTAFGSDAARLAGVAASKGAEGFDVMRTAVEKQGTAAQVAATQNQGLPGIIENITNTIDTLKLGLYDIISGPLKDALGGLSTSISTHKPELIAVFTDIGEAAVTMAEFVIKSTGMVAEGVGELISPLTATIAALLHGVAEFERIGGFTDLADKLDGAGNSLSNFDQGLVDFGEKAKNVSLAGLYDDIKKSGEQAETAAKFTRDLGGNIALLPDQKTVVLTAPTADVLAGIDKTKYAIEAIPGTKDFKVIAKTDEATAGVNAWVAQQTGKTAELSIGANMTPANQDVKRWGDQLALGAGISVPVHAAPVGGPLNIGTGHAAGGPISGPGSGTSDSIPIWASNGEFVVKAAAARKNMPLLEVINSGGMPGFAGGGVVGPDVAAAQAMAGTPYSKGNRTDCSGMAARVIARTLGLPESGLMTTKNAAQWLSAAGFQPGTGGPGQISVGWYDHGPGQNDGHMAITLSDGENAESGGKNGVFTVGAGAAGASSPQFDQHMFLPTLFGEGQAGSLGSTSGYGAAAPGTAGVGPNGEAGTYSAPSAKSVREADEKVADADARVHQAELKQKELKADAKESEKQSAQADLDKAKREAADARADADDAKKGKFTPGSPGSSASGASGKLSLPSSFSGFGSAIGEFAGGQIGSALGAFGIPDSPPWLQAASQLIGNIGIGGGSASPLSAGSTGMGTMPPDNAGNMHGTRAGQAPGPVTNIYAQDAEGALVKWQRIQDQRMAKKLSVY